ncbi:MAG: Sec-independent protein translocase subunit TatA/TatB [Solirubrobacteraceae bacterium]
MGLDNPLHIAILLIILLLVFGAKRLPEMGKSVGSGLRGFRDSLSSDSSPVAQLSTPAERPASTPAAEPADERVAAQPVGVGETARQS